MVTKGVAPFPTNTTVLPTIIKQKQIITMCLSVWNTDCMLRRNKQGGNTRVSVGVRDVLTDR